MESITELGIDLFGKDLPSMDDIKTLSEVVHCSESNQIAFSEQVEANMARTSPKTHLAVGIGLFILARNAEAVQKLQKATSNRRKKS